MKNDYKVERMFPEWKRLMPTVSWSTDYGHFQVQYADASYSFIDQEEFEGLYNQAKNLEDLKRQLNA